MDAARSYFISGRARDQQKQDVLQEVFPSMEGDGAPRLIAYNGGFDTFAAECLHLAKSKTH